MWGIRVGRQRPQEEKGHSAKSNFFFLPFPVPAVVERGVPGESEGMSLVPLEGMGGGERRPLSVHMQLIHYPQSHHPPKSSSFFGVLRWDHGNRQAWREESWVPIQLCSWAVL